MREVNAVNRIISFAGAGVIVFGMAVAANGAEVQFSAGQLGGGWYTMSSGIAKLVMDANADMTVKVVPGGGTANPSVIQKGKTDFGMGLDIFTFAARNGKDLYADKPHDKLLMVGQSFSDNYLHFIRGKGKEYDLEGLLTKAKNVNIAVTQSGSSDEITFRYVMNYFGTNYDDLRKNRGFKINHGNYNEIASQFKDGQVDYVFMSQGIPGAAVVEMIQGRDTELVPWPAKLTADLSKQYGYTDGSFPPDTYKGQVGQPKTLVMATTLMVGAHVDEDVVYKFTKAICDNESKLPSIHQGLAVFHCQKAATAHAIDLHPGAIKAYKELGFLK